MAEAVHIEHNSQDVAYRFPTGARPAGSVVWLGVRVAGAAEASGELRLWQDGRGERLYPLRVERSAKDGALWLGAEIVLPEESGLVWYYFTLTADGQTVYYGNNAERLGGVGKAAAEPPPSFQITVYDKDADTPAWFRRSVIYQIFPDRFCRGGDRLPKKRRAVLHASWQDAPQYYKDEVSGEVLAYDFFGGDLAGIRSRLPYLRDLGISVIYLNPVFEAESNHRYDTGDYKKIDPLLGTEEEFRELCQHARALGIRIILDGVFSHTGSNSRYFNRRGEYDSVGAYQSPESPYYPWYDFVNYPQEYRSWWGFSTLPNVRETEPSYMDFIIRAPDSVLHHWLAAGISGFRLDVIDELPAEFSQAFYREMKRIDPEAVLIGEIWEDASNKIAYGKQRAYLSGHEIDGAMNYPFRAATLDFLLGKTEAAEMNRRLESLRENYPAAHFYAMMNLLGSHDVERLLTVLGEAPSPEGLTQRERGAYRLPKEQARLGKKRVELALLWQMTYPGVPSLYYGDEIGMEGFRDPYNRAPYDWQGGDASLRDKTRRLIRFRNENPALSTGEFIPLYFAGDVYAYARLVRGGDDVFGAAARDQVFVVALNRGRETAKVELPVGDIAQGAFRLVVTAGEGEADGKEGKEAKAVKPDNGVLRLSLPPLSGGVWQEAAQEPRYPREAGILLHVTSLPSPYGTGNLGPEAYAFVDFLAEAGQKVWQILPLGPVRGDASPYASPSAFAGDPRLVSPYWLEKAGWLMKEELFPPSDWDEAVDGDYQAALLRRAWERFQKKPPEEYAAFCREESGWLEGYALYEATRASEKEEPWFQWLDALRRLEPGALAAQARRVKSGMDYIKFQQYCFFRQWEALHRYARQRGVRIMGDMPLFLALDSGDVWQNQALFQLDGAGRPLKVAGVPPDYFSPDGQLWGNPQYDWDAMQKTGFAWWIERFRHLLRLVDIVRLDHFRGLEAYWEIDGGEKTAAVGKWVKGPGEKFFTALRAALGDLPLVAEDLGALTPEVEALRTACGFPGMKVLEFELLANGTPRVGSALPEDCFAYTGTHDNNTVVGWYEKDLTPCERRKLSAYCGFTREAPPLAIAARLVNLTYASKARLAITPLQDILGLGEEARMNRPGTVGGGNWSWRMPPNALTPQLRKRLKALCERYQR